MSLPNRRPDLSLLSLSAAAASVSPISMPQSSHTPLRPSSGIMITAHQNTHISLAHLGPKHRRLSSAGKTRRRMSDARDAATRPSPASLQNAALSSLASLSLSSSPSSNSSHDSTTSASHFSAAQDVVPAPTADATAHSGSLDDHDLPTSLPTHSGSGTSAGIIKSGKKRGTIFTCESCSKVYRHPSCLIKHRWEHTPQWREASKFVLSKHQQVQLLEAAAILSHLSPSSKTGTSLPEDRSLWPTFLSGGIVPPPAPGGVHATASASKPISSSVPASSVLGRSGRAGSAGPRRQPASPRGITQLRPGMRHSHAPSSPVPVPVPAAPATDSDAQNLLALGSASVHSDFWDSPTSPSFYDASPFSSASASVPRSGWTHPCSSVRSMSASSSSRSSEDCEPADVDDATYENVHVYGNEARGRMSDARFRWKSEEEDAMLSFTLAEREEEAGMMGPCVARKTEQQWDGMEMEMEMD